MALHSRHLNILSICTGGGGLDLGFELAIPGARTVCMVEREAFAVAQLVSAMEAGLMAPAAIWSDARTFDGRRWRGCVDGLIGGIPCQPHSLAGRKRGSLDARDLWSDARRIIVQSRAWFVVIENVSGMLSAGDDEIAGAERVHRDLHKLGFTVEGGLFTAAEIGASHNRERFFLLAVADTQSVRERRGQRDIRSEDGRQGRTLLREHIGSSHEMAHSGSDGQFWSEKPHIWSIKPRQPSPRWGDTERCDRALADAGRCGHDRRQDGKVGIAFERTPFEGPSIALFPPRPDDAEGWTRSLISAAHLEPSVRRVADGMATHVDELRMLGNGVVPLQAGYAIRTLAQRLAQRGHDRLWKLCQ